MMQNDPFLPPTIADLEVLAEQAFEEIPEDLRKLVQGVAILMLLLAVGIPLLIRALRRPEPPPAPATPASPPAARGS